jgi:hypothetical protein
MQRVKIYDDLLHLTGEWMNADMLNRGTGDPPSSLFPPPFFRGRANVPSAPLWIRHCICKLLMNYVLGKRILNILNHVIFFLRKYKYRCISFKNDWWLILKNISLLVTNFIFWLGRLIFSVSINSHPDNIYI